jgi:hypothetical protein
MMNYHEKRLVDCVRDKTTKGEALPLTKVSLLCEMDFRTVKNHFSNIVGKDLGDGTKILSREKCATEYYRDPPEAQDQTLPVLAIVLTGIIVGAAVILELHSSRSQSQVRTWVPVLSPSAFVPVLSGRTYSSTV